MQIKRHFSSKKIILGRKKNRITDNLSVSNLLKNSQIKPLNRVSSLFLMYPALISYQELAFTCSIVVMLAKLLIKKKSKPFFILKNKTKNNYTPLSDNTM